MTICSKARKMTSACLSQHVRKFRQLSNRPRVKPTREWGFGAFTRRTNPTGDAARRSAARRSLRSLHRPRLEWASARCRLIESNVRAVFVLIADVLMAEPHQMPSIQLDHMVQHLAANAAHPSFRHSVLPGTPNTRPHNLDPAHLQELSHQSRIYGPDRTRRSGRDRA